MAQWSPFQEMEALRREVDRIFDSFGLRTGPVFRTAFLPGRAAREYPLCNLYEDKEAVYVEALAPGVDPASLNLTTHSQHPDPLWGKTRPAGRGQVRDAAPQREGSREVRTQY